MELKDRKSLKNLLDWYDELIKEKTDRRTIISKIYLAYSNTQVIEQNPVDNMVMPGRDDVDGSGWQPIETAPKDGTEILGWRDDCGMMLIRYTSLEEFLSTQEIEELDCDDDTIFKNDWFYADFVQGGRLEGDEVPTHWFLPRLPEA